MTRTIPATRWLFRKLDGFAAVAQRAVFLEVLLGFISLTTNLLPDQIHGRVVLVKVTCRVLLSPPVKATDIVLERSIDWSSDSARRRMT